MTSVFSLDMTMMYRNSHLVRRTLAMVRPAVSTQPGPRAVASVTNTRLQLGLQLQLHNSLFAQQHLFKDKESHYQQLSSNQNHI